MKKCLIFIVSILLYHNFIFGQGLPPLIYTAYQFSTYNSGTKQSSGWKDCNIPVKLEWKNKNPNRFIINSNGENPIYFKDRIRSGKHDNFFWDLYSGYSKEGDVKILFGIIDKNYGDKKIASLTIEYPSYRIEYKLKMM